MASLDIKNVTKQFGAVTAIDGLSLSIDGPELVALLGPSGCGKTTLLRMIAGFVEASSGRIFIGDRDVTNMPSNRRNTGMIFQNYALFPHMTVGENVGFGLEMRRVPKMEREKKVLDALSLVHLEGYEDRYPRQMSGGQRQRVAIARALVVQPDVFLLDEPLSNLDAVLRQSVGNEIRGLQQRLKLTSVFVTHDQKEALMLADRLVVMKDGKIIQSGTGDEVYNSPSTKFVASFLGKSNFFNGRKLAEDRFVTDSGLEIQCTTKSDVEADSTTLSLRPENIQLGSEATRLANAMEGKIERITYLGSLTELEIRLSPTDLLTVQTQNSKNSNFGANVGSTILAGWTGEAAHMVSSDA